MRVLGVNAVFHDPAAALVVDGQVVAAASHRFVWLTVRSRREDDVQPVIERIIA